MMQSSDRTYKMALTIEKVETRLVRTKISIPVRTSFGIMQDRPTLLVRVTDADGYQGYGEIWCNFPVCGAEHRLKLVDTEIAPRVIGKSFEGPEDLYKTINAQLRILRLQTGEPGPIAQAIAGLDIAVWDLLGKRADKPLYEMLGAKANQVPAYASGINPVGVLDTVTGARDKGHRNFKLKVGFGEQIDKENVAAIAGDISAGETFLLDANQGWSYAEAKSTMNWIQDFGPRWIEEPMAVDTPIEDWQNLKRQTVVPLAGAENFLTREEYDAVIDQKWLDFVQPDIAKWGGFTECLPVAKGVVDAGMTYCPHSLGGGIALAASAHLLAAAGGTGLLECDVNENSFRDEVFTPNLKEGFVTLPTNPGLGVSVKALEAQF